MHIAHAEWQARQSARLCTMYMYMYPCTAIKAKTFHHVTKRKPCIILAQLHYTRSSLYFLFRTVPKSRNAYTVNCLLFAVLQIRIRIRRICTVCVLGRIHQSEVRIRIRTFQSSCKNSKKNLDSYCFVTSLSLKNDVNVLYLQKVISRKNQKKLVFCQRLKGQ